MPMFAFFALMVTLASPSVAGPTPGTAVEVVHQTSPCNPNVRAC